MAHTRSSLPVLLVASSVLLVAIPCTPGVGLWTGAGPDGGVVMDLERDPADPMNVYAVARDTGVFKSTDGGNTWTSSSTGLPADSGSLYVLVADPLAPGHLYLGASSRLYRSADGGASWEDISANLPSPAGVYSLAVDPTAPGTVVAGHGSGVYLTSNGGDTWTDASSGLPGSQVVNALVFDPSDSDVIYAGIGNSAVYKSVDHGTSWNPSGTGLPASPVLDLEIDPGSPLTVYAGTVFSGVYVTLNGGVSWQSASTGLPTSAYVWDLEVDPASPSTVYAGLDTDGVYVSTNGGGLWTAAATGLPPEVQVLSLSLDPSDPTELLAGLGGHGVYGSHDSGASWSMSNQGLVAVLVNAVAVDPGNSWVALAATQLSGMFRTDDGGATWTASNSGLPAPDISDVVYLGSSSTTVLAGTGRSGVFLSTDGGATWSPASTGLPASPTLHCLAVDPVDPSAILAGLDDSLYRSTDGATSWSQVGAGLPTGTGPFDLAANSSGSTWFAALDDDDGVYISVNDGVSWTAASTGLPTAPEISAIAVDPTDPFTVYAGGWSGLYKSDDGGATWNGLSPSQGPITGLAVDASDTSRVYAVHFCAGFDVSVDAGANWQLLNAGLPTTCIYALAAAPNNPAMMYLGTDSRGVFRHRFPVATVTASIPATSEAGPNPGEVTITLDRTVDGTVDLEIETAGSATEGVDYQTLPSPVVVPVGQDRESVSIVPLDDAIDEDTGETVEVSLPPAAAYLLGSPSAASVNIADDDVAGIEVSPLTLEVQEGGPAAPFTVVLESEPTADVTIALTPSDLSEAVMTPTQLTFTPTTWDTPQEVAVSPVDDPDHDGDVLSWIVTELAVSADLSYDGLDPDDVQVTTLDDEPEVVFADGFDTGGTTAWSTTAP